MGTESREKKMRKGQMESEVKKSDPPCHRPKKRLIAGRQVSVEFARIQIPQSVMGSMVLQINNTGILNEQRNPCKNKWELMFKFFISLILEKQSFGCLMRWVFQDYSPITDHKWSKGKLTSIKTCQEVYDDQKSFDKGNIQSHKGLCSVWAKEEQTNLQHE